MKASCKALFGLVVCLSSAVASAQMAPDNRGDIGLFTMPSADTARPGQVTLGLYGWKEQLVAANLVGVDNPDRTRLFSHWAGELSFGLGLTSNWDAFISAGAERYENRGGWLGGAITYVYGMRVLNLVDEPAARAVTPIGELTKRDPET